jgi:hypothetical protein
MKLRPISKTATGPRDLISGKRPIASLTLDGENARKHSKTQIKALARAIGAFDIVTPVLIDGGGKVLSGHARIEACRQLKWTEIPTIVVDHLSPEQARAFTLADNRIAELAEWDQRQLGLHLKALSEIELDFDIEATGFTMAEIDMSIESLGDLQADGKALDEAPIPPGPAVCKLGDSWRLGPHSIVCGSSLVRETYVALLGEKRSAAVFADAPYNVPIHGNVSGKGKRRHREFASAVGEMSDAEFTTFLAQACHLAAEFSAEGSVHFWCMDWRHLEHLIAASRSAYDALINLCVWVKNNGGMGSLYRSAHELVAVFRYGTRTHRNNVQLGRHGRNRTNVWSYPGANTFLRSSEEGGHRLRNGNSASSGSQARLEGDGH